MKYILLLLIGFLLTGLMACKEDKEGTLVLHFKAMYDGQVLPTFSTRPFTGNEQVQFTHMSMLVSDMELFRGTTDQVLDDIELVDLSFDEISSADDGYVMRITQLPAATYDGIRFGIGLPPELNAKKPADFLSDNPLSKTGYYWTPWTSYIFTKIEGRLDSLGTNLFDTGFAYHTGTNQLYRIIEGMVPLTIEDGKETTLEIRVDFHKLMTGVDIKTDPQNQNPGDTIQIHRIINNLSSSLTLVK